MAHPQGAEAERQTYPSSSLLNGASNGPSPPVVELSETEIILGVAKRTTLRLRRRVRESLPSGGQWEVACVTLAAAAGIGFVVGRSSVKHGAVAIAGAACPDTADAGCESRFSAAHAPAPHACVSARDPALGDNNAEGPTNPASISVAAAAPVNPVDDAERQATEKAIGCAITRGKTAPRIVAGRGVPRASRGVTVTFQPSGDVKTAIYKGGPSRGPPRASASPASSARSGAPLLPERTSPFTRC